MVVVVAATAVMVAIAATVMVVAMGGLVGVGLGGAAAHVTKALLYQHAWSRPPSAYVLRCRWWSRTISLSASWSTTVAELNRCAAGLAAAAQPSRNRVDDRIIVCRERDGRCYL